MRISDLVLPRGLPPLTPEQRENIRRLAGISREFGREAGIPLPEPPPVSGQAIVLESGHQPNFLPYPGIWKKALLLGKIREAFAGKGCEVVAFYGFLDYDNAASPYLSGNTIPSLQKEGTARIGFRVSGGDRFRCFHTLEKPGRDRWRQEMERIAGSYRKNAKDLKLDPAALQPGLDDLIGVLERSYQDARTLADLNAFTFARLCARGTGQKIHFFRYSDIMREGLFLDEWKRILAAREPYIREFNAAIAERGLPLAQVTGDHVPFWYQCECNGKVPLAAQGGTGAVTGRCPACSREHRLELGEDFSGLRTYYPRISPRAVPRNLMMAGGIGTHIFIAGSGGGLRYGLVADVVARALGFRAPRTMSWSSRDFYIGPVQASVLRELARTFGVTLPDLVTGRHIPIVRNSLEGIERTISELESGGVDPAQVRKHSCRLYNAGVLLEIARKVFGLTPSILDLLVSADPAAVLRGWEERLETLGFVESGGQLLSSGDVCHGTGFMESIKYGDIPKIYHALETIGVT